jgi:hypothetical protein
MVTKYMVIFGILFLILHKLHSVNRRTFENFFGEDVGRVASYFRWDTEKANKLIKENFGSSLVPTASVTSGLSNDLISENKPEIFRKLSVNNKKMNEKFNNAANHRFGNINSTLLKKMYPAEHLKLNKQIKKCKKQAVMIGGRKGRELFQACKREYNKRLNKTNTEQYINTYVTNSNVTPKVADTYLKSDIVRNKKKFKKNKIKYLEGKDSKMLFRENFGNVRDKQKHIMIIKRIGKIFKVTMLIVFISIIIYIIWDQFLTMKDNRSQFRKNMRNYL